VWLTSQSIPGNTSTLGWSLRMEERTNASPYNLSATSSASAVVGGLVYSSGGLTYDFRGTNAVIGIASGSTVVAHNADGTATISVGASYNGGSPLGTASISSGLTLPTIPRNRLKVGVDDAWKTAEVYVGVNGVWRMAQPYVGVSGAWKLNNNS
jgi:hypothetical protein